MNPDILVLAIQPTPRGFAWILFEREEPIDWGIASARVDKNAKLLARFVRIMTKYEPDALLLEAFEDASTPRGTQAKLLCRGLVHLARGHGLDVRLYQRSMIQTAFVTAGASTRYEIAEAVRERLPALGHRMPKKRKAWESIDRRQALFDAAAIALTHFALR